MGYETVKDKEKIKLWNTVIDAFEGEFDSCIQVMGYLEKKHKSPYSKEEMNQFFDFCEKSPPMDEFLHGMRVITPEMIKKHGIKAIPLK